ncbi:unnamed protein product, partial [Brenthis ino]
MSKWSDIVFWDSTYRLLNNNFVLSLFHVEDSNGFTRTVGVGLLANEEAETFKWLLTCFREANPEACLKIRSIMTDKDPSERAALREIFPEVNLLICSFHVQQIFHRQITVGKRGVTSEEKDDLLLILRKLVYSESEEDYDETYTEFCEVAPEEVIDYYNTNWHSIKDEWVLYRMNAHGNLNNNTNNRAESTHAKGKQIVPLHSSLVEFGKNIFVFFRAQARQIKIKSGKLMTTKSAEAFTTADEKNYCELLTPKAFAELQPELLEYPDVQIMSSNVAQKECSFELNGRTITSSLTKCKCLKNRSMFLPCKHVFATRDFFEQPLFDKTLCAERWLRGYSVQCDTEISKLTHFPNCSQSSNGSVTQIRQSNEHVTLEKLAKKYDTSFNLLAHVGSLSANQNLQNKSDCLHDVMDLWAKGKNVRLSKITNNELNVIQCTLKLKSTNDKRRHLFCMKKTPREIQLSEKKIKILNRLLSLWKKNVPVIAKESDGDCSLNDSATLNTSEINVPEPTLIKGRPRQAFDTYIKYKTLYLLSKFFKQLIPIPSKRDVKRNLPSSFKTNKEYSNVFCIIDCFEIEIEKPSNPINQSLTWSQYKNANTLKYLIASTPDGFINFVSAGYGGRISDTNIVESCGFLDILPLNCTVLADRGFKHIDTILSRKQIKLLRPPSASKDMKLSKVKSSLVYGYMWKGVKFPIRTQPKVTAFTILNRKNPGILNHEESPLCSKRYLAVEAYTPDAALYLDTDTPT